ncbi:MAG: VWA domain-containing protein, partial [Candidatus Hydrogenedentes bacterium]|nr:VWA domain-containing protein [Candidatus Hydrogenedentota bacterium]
PWLDCGIQPGLTAATQPGSIKALAGETSTGYLKVSLYGSPAFPGERPPINVAIVIDQSGSMQGQKIEDAKNAALMAVDQLQPEDIVSLVTYESNVHILIPATKLTDKESFREAIRAIQANGSTALYGGVEAGLGELKKFAESGKLSRLILLSDGLANVGPSSTPELADLGVRCARNGVTVSTIGLGLDYNEDLMTKLASSSDGNHYFAKNSDELPEIYEKELKTAMNATATDIEITVHCAEGVRPVRVLNREAVIEGNVVRMKLRNIWSSQEKYAVIEVELPAKDAGTTLEVAKTEVKYTTVGDATRRSLASTATVTYTASAAEVEAAENRDVMVGVVRQIIAENNRIGMEMQDEGKSGLSVPWFVDNALKARQMADKYNSPELRQDAEENLKDAESIRSGSYSIRRKTIKENQYVIQQQSAN